MKRAFRDILKLLIIIFVFGLVGCSKPGANQTRHKHKFQVVSVDKVSGSIGDKWAITLTVANNTASNMRITSSSAYVKHNGRKVGRLVLDGEVVLPRRRCSQVEVPLRLTVSNPIVAFSLLNKLRKGDFSGVTVEYNIALTAFASHRLCEQEGVSLEQLAQQFNLGLKK